MESRPIAPIGHRAPAGRRTLIEISDPRRGEFERTVCAHAAVLFRFAYWLCGDRAIAEGLVRETLLRAWRAWSGLREPEIAKAWLFTTLRDELARAAWTGSLPAPRVAPGSASPAAPDPGAESDVRGALAALPAPLREALLLQVVAGFSCAEIGWLLETTEAAAIARLTRARRALRRLCALPSAAHARRVAT